MAWRELFRLKVERDPKIQKAYREEFIKEMKKDTMKD